MWALKEVSVPCTYLTRDGQTLTRDSIEAMEREEHLRIT